MIIPTQYLSSVISFEYRHFSVLQKEHKVSDLVFAALTSLIKQEMFRFSGRH